MKSTKLILSALLLCSAILAFKPVDIHQQGRSNTIVDIAVETDNLSTLVAAIKAADLVGTLQSDGPFTVFAPTNQAFENLPDGTLDTLLKPENKEMLADILTYHVVPGKVTSGDLKDGMKAKTAQGSTITIELGDNVMVNGAKVVTADVEASNGVVHIIDSVIVPPEEEKEEKSGY